MLAGSRAFSCCALACVISISAASLYADDKQSQQLKQIRGDIKTLTVDIESDRKTHSQIFVELKQADKEIAAVSKRLRRISNKLRKQKKAYHQTQKDIKKQRVALVQQKNRLTQHIRAGYRQGQQPMLKLLLNQDDPAQVGRTMVYYRYLAEDQLQAIDQTKASVAALAAAEQRLKEETAKLADLKLNHEVEQQALVSSKKTRARVLAQLDRRIHTKEQKLQQLRDNEKRLAGLIQNLQQQLKDKLFAGKSFKQLNGKLLWPTKGKVRHKFGARRNYGNLTWRGVLISGKEGQDIQAVAPGRVVFSDWLKGYGLTLILDHGKGYMSIYGHNESLYRVAGDQVSARDVVASLGRSGGNDHQGLYFEIRHKGKPMNPARWCR